MQNYILSDFLSRQLATPFDDHWLPIAIKYLNVSGWLAGGAIRHALSGGTLTDETDFDYFFSSEGGYNQAVERAEAKGWTLSKTTPNHSEYLVTNPDAPLPYRVQLIKAVYAASCTDLIDRFDYTICQFAVDTDGILWCGDHSLWDLARKRLAVHRITFPVSSLRRLLKYTSKGFYACSGCLAAVAEGIVSLGWTRAQGVFYVD